jgi:hypothetical protein
MAAEREQAEQALLPLPRGEGWGEGSGEAVSSHSSATRLNPCTSSCCFLGGTAS